MLKSIILCTFLLFTIACSSSKQHISDVNVEYVRASEIYDHEGPSKIQEMIIPYKTEMESEMGLILGYLPEDLIKDRPNSNMGNWFADALLEMSNKYDNQNVDIAIQNYGGLRIPFLAKGEITKGNIYELMPFDNKLIVLDLNATLLQRLLDEIANSGGWPISQGLNFKIDNGKAVAIKFNEMDLDINKTYRVAMPDYIANGGGDCDFLIEIEQKHSGTYIRDVIIEYLSDLKNQNREITIDKSKRIF